MSGLLIQFDADELVGKIDALMSAMNDAPAAMQAANLKIAELFAQKVLENLKEKEKRGTRRADARTDMLERAIVAPENREADEYGFRLGLTEFLDSAVVGHGRNSHYWRAIEYKMDDYTAQPGFTNNPDRSPDAPGTVLDPATRYWAPRTGSYGEQLFMPQLNRTSGERQSVGVRRKHASYGRAPRWILIKASQGSGYAPFASVAGDKGLWPERSEMLAVYKQYLPKALADLITI